MKHPTQVSTRDETTRVYCQCGKPLKYLDSWIGDQPFVYLCDECKERNEEGPICPICESRGRVTRDTEWTGRSIRGGMLYKCNQCKQEFYG